MPTDNVRRYQQLNKELAELKTERDKADGELARIRKDLKKSFNVDSLEAAEELLKDMESESAALDRKLSKAIDDFESKWGDS